MIRWCFRPGAKSDAGRPAACHLRNLFGGLRRSYQTPSALLIARLEGNPATLAVLSPAAFISVSLSCANLIKLFSHTAIFNSTCAPGPNGFLRKRHTKVRKKWRPMVPDRCCRLWWLDGHVWPEMDGCWTVVSLAHLIIEALCAGLEPHVGHLAWGIAFFPFVVFVPKVIRAVEDRMHPLVVVWAFYTNEHGDRVDTFLSII